MQKNIIRLALITGALLLIPLIAMQFSTDVQWTLFDFVFMGGLVFFTGLSYLLIARKTTATAYKAGAAIALLASFLLVWVNGAVDIIGDGPVNLLYFAVTAVLILGALLARFKPKHMTVALLATAGTQALVPVLALMFSTAVFAPSVIGVFAINSFFVFMFVVSAVLFWQASTPRSV